MRRKEWDPPESLHWNDDQMTGGVCCYCTASAEALERGNLARDYEKRLQRMEQECAHKIRAAERKMAKR